MMEQFFAHYKSWEDYKAGMYNTHCDEKDNKIVLAKQLLSNAEEFNDACRIMVKNWTIAAKVNLTNPSINKRAWIGQAACCYKIGIPEIFTRISWNQLNEIQQKTANLVADRVIQDYISSHSKNNVQNQFEY